MVLKQIEKNRSCMKKSYRTVTSFSLHCSLHQEALCPKPATIIQAARTSLQAVKFILACVPKKTLVLSLYLNVHCVTGRKAAGSIPDGVIGILH
jgi:hypothetical protein